MEILKKKDYDKCEMDGFKLNQKVLLNNRKNSRILAIDTSGDDIFKFFVKDNEGNYCKHLTECCGVKEVFDKKGTWCRKEEISPIAEPVLFDVSERLKESLSLCKEENEEKYKYSKYKDRVSFVKTIGKSKLRFSDDSKLVEVEKEKDAEAVVVMIHNNHSDIEGLLRIVMSLNPDRHTAILECILCANISSISGSTDDLLYLLVDADLIIDYRGSYYKAVLIKI